MTNKDKVLNYIERNGSIDQWRAFEELRVMRLAAVVFELKAAGIPIATEIKYNYDRDGKVKTRWAEYRLGYTRATA